MTEDEEFSLADDIQRYYLWVLSAIGIPANILAVMVILTMQKMTTATFLIAALAVCDSLSLVSKLVYVNLFLHEVLSEVICKMEFISGFLSSLANWTLTIICVERFVSVCYPLKKENLVTMKLCYVILGISTVILLVFYMSIFIVMRYYYYDPVGFFSGSMCTTHDDYVTFWVNYWHWINSSVVLFCPYITIITLTVVIIVKLRGNAVQRRRMFQASSQGTSPNSNINSFNPLIPQDNQREERVLTLMLSLTAVLFLVLTLPSCVYFLLYPRGENFLFYQIQYVLYDSTHALNFFMYFLTAKCFRLQLYRIFCCGKVQDHGSNEMNETVMSVVT